MAASFSDCTYVGPYAANGSRIYDFTINDTVANSQDGGGYNSFWSPLFNTFRIGDVCRVTCNNGKWLGVVIQIDGAGTPVANWTVTVDPVADNVNSF